tara:strand:+ start:128 stop:475 length:348 start_codon:yes stop_codon:yes gene_type:complete
MWLQLFFGSSLFIALHLLIWFSTNLQFVDGFNQKYTLPLALTLSIPATLCAYYGSKLTYGALEDSLWAVRFIGFGTSYLVFPLLTWILLGESMFTHKTLACIFLSIIIVYIQVFW